MRRFDEKVAIITGGASGIGLALAEELLHRGAIVVLADRDAGAGEVALARLAALGRARFVELDVRERAALSHLVDDTVETFGRLDFIFNNAGITSGGELLDTPPELWDRMLDINLRGVVHGIEAAYPVMARQGFGHIVNTSSMAGLFPIPLNVPYVTSKFAVYGLSVALRPEAAAHGARVSVVCPGPVATPLLSRIEWVGTSEEEQQMVARLTRGIDPKQCARVVLRGVARNRAVITVSAIAWVGWRAHGWFPGLFRWVSGALAQAHVRRRTRKRSGSPPSTVPARPPNGPDAR